MKCIAIYSRSVMCYIQGALHRSLLLRLYPARPQARAKSVPPLVQPMASSRSGEGHNSWAAWSYKHSLHPHPTCTIHNTAPGLISPHSPLSLLIMRLHQSTVEKLPQGFLYTTLTPLRRSICPYTTSTSMEDHSTGHHSLMKAGMHHGPGPFHH